MMKMPKNAFFLSKLILRTTKYCELKTSLKTGAFYVNSNRSGGVEFDLCRNDSSVL